MNHDEVNTLRNLGAILALLASVASAQDPPNAKDIALFERNDPQLQARRFAVVVGVGTYSSLSVSRLDYADKDAKDVAEALKQAGWIGEGGTVALLTSDFPDAARRPDTKEIIVRRLQELATKAEPQDTILFYYSGHGFVGPEQEGYVCPSNVDTSTTETLRQTGLSLAQIRSILQSSKSVRKLIILDACRETPGQKGPYRLGYKLEELQASQGLGILYATKPGGVSFEPGEGELDEKGIAIRNGVFTHFLLLGLAGEARINEDEFLTFRELSCYVADRMKSFTESDERIRYHEQRPFLAWDGGVNDDVLLKELGPAAESHGSTESSPSNRDITHEAPPTPARAERKPPPPDPELRRVLEEIDASMVRIEPGTFWMGSDHGEDDERPGHRVVLSKAYEISKFEVRGDWYRIVMGSNPSSRAADDLPVTNVSWPEALNFCNALNELTGCEYRLPTEAEWERACRAGTDTDFSFGDDQLKLNEYGWYSGINEGALHPVGLKLKNGLGLFDMHGNVAEWCADGYDGNAYRSRPGGARDPFVAVTGSVVQRGGNWCNEPRDLRSANRSEIGRDVKIDTIGFRLARTP